MIQETKNMEKVKKALYNAKTKVAQIDPGLEKDINLAINDISPTPSPKIAPYAKMEPKVTVKDNAGVVHSFAVEIKSSKNGSIPDTELMSKILQAIEGRTTSEMSNVSEFGYGEEPQRFEVVSFKYERKDEKSK